MTYYFSKRNELADMIHKAQENSPILDMDSYFLAYATALVAEGFDVDKVVGFVNDVINESVEQAPDWFTTESSNIFRKVYDNNWNENIKELSK